MASTLILNGQAKQLHDNHGKASQNSRNIAEALAESYQAYIRANRMLGEWMSSRLNPDSEFIKLREAAAEHAAHYSKLLDESRSAQTLEMRTLHNELDGLEFAVNAIQSKLGITST